MPVDIPGYPVYLLIMQKQNISNKLLELYSRQAGILGKYLEVSAEEMSALSVRDTDKLTVYHHIKDALEKKLKAIQKVIFPLEHMYKQKYEDTDSIVYDNPLENIKTEIEELKKEIIAGIGRNRELLNTQLASLKEELQKMRVYNPYKSALKKNVMPAFIDITG